ncbi:hypothetical protein ACSRUE_02285 [Sorangium sp. KYC3313]
MTLDVLGDMPHNGPVLADFHPEGARGTDTLGAYLRASLSPGARVGDAA